MTIYKKRPQARIYRKIYEQHYGPIPKEENGRTYEIHHIDGDHCNNDPLNLRAVTIQEHYNIHHSQKDWSACLLISERMNMTPEEISELGKLSAKRRVELGPHNFLTRPDGSSITSERVKNGTHHFIGGSIGGDASRRAVINGTHVLLGGNVQRQQILDGKNKLVGGTVQRDTAKKLLNSGKFHSSVIRTCPHCGTTCKGNAYFRYHDDRCKNRSI